MKSGVETFEMVVSINVLIGAWMAVGAAYWVYYATPPKGGVFV
jgi:hypothetical protein